METPPRDATELIAGLLPPDVAKRALVSTGSSAVPTGSYLRIASDGRAIYARATFLMSARRPSAEEIWLDQWQRQDLRIEPGMPLHVEVVPPDELPPLTQIELRCAEETPGGAATILAGFLAAQKFPIHCGFRFEFTPPGSTSSLVFMAQRILADAAAPQVGLCTPATTVIIKRGSIDTLSNAVSYDDIGGLDSQIRELREVIELPMRMSASSKRIGAVLRRGIIFHGQSGTGKTLLAKAAATSSGLPLILLDPSDVLARHGAEGEVKIDKAFDDAQAHAGGCILLIEDLDLIAHKRDAGNSASWFAAAVLRRMDSLHLKGNVIVIATTNRIDEVDELLRRHGRFSREILLTAPSEQERVAILNILTRGMSLREGGADRERMFAEISACLHGYVGADLRELCLEAGLNALRRAHPLRELDLGVQHPQEPLNVRRIDFNRAIEVVKPSALKEVMVVIPNVSFGDIVGLDSVVDSLRERVLLPLRHPEVFIQMGLKMESGVLLFGPAGTGKTMLAKALAKEAGANFMLVQGPELLSKWVGESEEGVRRVFDRARMLRPCIIFFDEIDALLPARNDRNDSGVSARVVNQFLAEMDGVVALDDVTVVGATNRPEMIDPAVLRGGRLGVHIHVPLPNATARMQILRGAVADSDAALDNIAAATDGWSGADIVALCRTAKLLALREVNFLRAVPVTSEHLRSALRDHYHVPRPAPARPTNIVDLP